jgi:hypothetical protein
MRLILATAAILALGTAAHADTMAHCSAAWKAKTTDATAAGTYKVWSTKCLVKSYTVATAVEAGPPDGATAKCKDGTYSKSKTARGRCSSHGGVDKVL